MSRSFAEGTSVPVERSEAEIKALLRRYGASEFMSGWDDRRAIVGFRKSGLTVRFVLTMPDPKERRFTHTEARGLPRNAKQAHDAWEMECRRAWRALALVIKAKLEAVETGIATFESEFLAYVVVPGGMTVGDTLIPQVRELAKSGKAPALMLGTGGAA